MHCIQVSKKPEQYQVVLGSLTTGIPNPSQGEISRNVSGFTFPKENNWNKGNFTYDILIVTLSEPVNYTDKITPACINALFDVTDDTECFVTGWGKNVSFESSVSSKYLRQLRTE